MKTEMGIENAYEQNIYGGELYQVVAWSWWRGGKCVLFKGTFLECVRFRSKSITLDTSKS